MAIQWGGWSGHLRVGIDVWTDGYDTWTPSINVYAAVYVQCDGAFNFSDQQWVDLYGVMSGRWNFFNGLQANQSVNVGTWTVGGQGQNYNGGPNYYFEARLGGAYNGAAPSVGVNFWLPARPQRAPAPPSYGPQWSDVRADWAWLAWGGTPDNGGSGLIEDDLNVSPDPNFSYLTVGTIQGGSSRAAYPLAPDTLYYSRARVRNGVGWSGWSGTTSGRTHNFQITGLTVSNLGPDSATLSWTKPGTTPDPSRYRWEIATDSGMANIVRSADVASWATSLNVAALVPGTKYWARVRAGTPQGWGVYSAVVPLETLSGAKVRKAGAWVDAPVYVRIGGQWKIAKVNKRVNGKWVL